METEEIPYWKDYKTNVTRGLIAAGICAGIFIVWFIAERIYERKHKRGRGEIGTCYNRESGQVTMKGLDNYGAHTDDKFK